MTRFNRWVFVFGILLHGLLGGISASAALWLFITLIFFIKKV